MNEDYDYEDGAPDWITWRAGTHTARKTHLCEACDQAIRPGERYTALVALHDGKFLYVKSHLNCPTWESHRDEEKEKSQFAYEGWE